MVEFFDLTCGIAAELALFDSKLAVLTESFGEGIVVDLQLGHPVVLQ